nr:MAG TPA: hypothetical protein [Caudoviricetes sp.]
MKRLSGANLEKRGHFGLFLAYFCYNIEVFP